MIPYLTLLAALAAPATLVHMQHIHPFGAAAACADILAQLALLYPVKVLDTKYICAIHANAAIGAAAVIQVLENVQEGNWAVRLTAVAGIGIAIGIALFCEDLQRGCCRWKSGRESRKQSKISRIESNNSLLNEHFRESFDEMDDREFVGSTLPEDSPSRNITNSEKVFAGVLVIVSGVLHTLMFYPFIYHLKRLENVAGVGLFGKISLFIAPFVAVMTLYFFTLYIISKCFCSDRSRNEDSISFNLKYALAWFCRGLISSSSLVCLLGSIYFFGFLDGFVLSQFSVFMNGIWAVLVSNTLKGCGAISIFLVALLIATSSASVLIWSSFPFSRI
jgi:hypothetical protein